MSSYNSILRQTALINKLQQSKSNTLIELQSYIQTHPQLDGKEYSDRTFQRDKVTIREKRKIDIQCDKSRNVYHIVTPTDELNIRALESFEMLNALMGKENFSAYIHFENRRPQGIQYFQTLLQAIKDHKLVRFKHQAFYEDNITDHLVEPYALKEFKGRWYVLVKEYEDDKVKRFGLDKMSQIECKGKKFKYPTDFDPRAIFKNCFGIITPQKGERVEEVILSFHIQQGKYVKSYPLHESQRELEGDNDEYKIALNIYITDDFIMEILSYGEDAEVIMPVSLRNTVKERFINALAYYT